MGNWQTAAAGNIQIGDDVRVAGSADGELEVIGVTEFDVPGEPDESWVEYTLSPRGEARKVYLVAGAAGGPAWSMFDELPSDMMSGPEWEGVVWKGNKPPKSVDVMGMPFSVDDDEFNYKVKVTETKRHPDGDITRQKYKARITDYDDGSESADNAVSLEIWNGGRSLSMGRPVTGAVEMCSNPQRHGVVDE